MSEQQQQQVEQAPDGAQPSHDPIAEAAARAEKAVQQRRQLGQRLDDALERNKELEKRLKALEKGSKPEPDGGGDMPEWAQALAGELKGLREEFGAQQQARMRNGIEDSILNKVPEGKRSAAKIFMRGLEAEGLIKLDGSMKPEQIAQQLKSAQPEIYTVPGSSNVATPTTPDGAIDWDQVTHKSQVPEGAWAEMPRQVLERLTQANRGSGRPMLLQGKG